mmetsp:Transcript_4854/g.9606  ORF Transcript_4854/g.9606 Transcript_4854/m.9606 type:complete len:81 (+) Transcript_4854:427-669(+)
MECQSGRGYCQDLGHWNGRWKEKSLQTIDQNSEHNEAGCCIKIEKKYVMFHSINNMGGGEGQSNIVLVGIRRPSLHISLI